MKKVLRTILLIINLIFAVALILSTLAGTLPPSGWVVVSLLSYGYFLLLAVNVLFIILWLCLTRWEFLLSVAAIAIRFSFVGLFVQVGGTETAEPSDREQLKVMTFNTHGFKGKDDDTLMTVDSGARMFLRLVDEEEPDVLCLQEYWNVHHMHDSLYARGYKAHFGVRGAKSYPPTLLFTRCQLVQGYEMDRRSKFYADIRKGELTVRICVVHMDSYHLSDEDKEGFENLTHAKPDSNTHNMLRKFAETTRQHETEWLTQLQPLIEESDGMPLIIAGDFNDTPASYIYQQITQHLTDAYVEEGSGFGTTYHGPYPAFRIDYLFHSQQLQTLAYKRIKSPISDHYPVVVTLTTDD